ncbi:MAG TPA: amidohydrolase family protein [candidate division Zixibacteria bacterium]|nr:amidohydrolase family protein [candidate division Zixibacteria bacterium]
MRAIDVHVHPSTRGVDAHACRYFRRNLSEVPAGEEEFAALFARHEVRALLIGWHPSTVAQEPRNDNDHVIDLATRHAGPFAGVLAGLDMGARDLEAVARRAEALARHPLVKGFKFHPPDQGFYPSDRRFYGVWEAIQAAGKPAMFHVGFTVLGANTDGGSGIALDYGRPIHLDTLARDFPKMKIVAAHPGWPWEQELIGVLTHKRNVYADTSGYLAEQLPEIFQKAMRGRLQDKVLFGTDFPYVDLEKALASLDRIELKDSAREKILFANAAALFGL